GGVRRVTAGVANGRAVDAWHRPELFLRTPETAHPEQRALEAVRKWRRKTVLIDEMSVRDGHRIGPTRQRLGLRRNGFGFSEHVNSLTMNAELAEYVPLTPGAETPRTSRLADQSGSRTARHRGCPAARSSSYRRAP